MRKLAVVGIGPGNYENMTIRADRALRECDVIVGYTVYVDLVKERYADKEFLTTPMLREVERCEMALETARGGKTVAMICSGDSGIYGMAALLYELRGEEAEPEIEVIPGLTAAARRAAHARFCRHQPERPADAVGEDRKAARVRRRGGSRHRAL